jgi:hypothetical protein
LLRTLAGASAKSEAGRPGRFFNAPGVNPARNSSPLAMILHTN